MFTLKIILGLKLMQNDKINDLCILERLGPGRKYVDLHISC